MRHSMLEPSDHFLADLRRCGLEMQKWDMQFLDVSASDVALQPDGYPAPRYDSWSDGCLGLFISDLGGQAHAVVESIVRDSFLAIDLPFPGRSADGMKGVINRQEVDVHPALLPAARDFATLYYLNPSDKLQVQADESGLRGAILLIGEELLSQIDRSANKSLASILSSLHFDDQHISARLELPAALSWRIRDLLGRRPDRGMSSLYYQAFASEIAWSIFDHVARQDEMLSSSGVPPQKFDRLEQVRSLIEADPIQHPNVDELTKVACMNRTTLRDLFKKTYGATISEYRNDLLMKRAMGMVTQGQLAISEISFRLGYSDTANFSVAFKRFYGAPPGSFRQIPGLRSRPHVRSNPTTHINE